MELNDFSSFFEIFTGTCFLYAGSETFRFAFNDTILTLNKTMNEIIGTVRVEIGKMVTSKPKWQTATNEQKQEVLNFVQHLIEQKRRELLFRKFPDSFKSVFLMTGFFCLSVLILGGFQQFFLCSLTTIVTLCCLIFVVFIYNTAVFISSFFEKHCGKNAKTVYPITAFLIATFVAAFYVNNSYWLSNHYQSHLNALNNSHNFVEKINLKKSFYDGHANIDERIWITLALLLAVSPFILHLIRVVYHKTSYKTQFQQLKLDMERIVRNFEDEDEKISDEILNRINELKEDKENVE